MLYVYRFIVGATVATLVYTLAMATIANSGLVTVALICGITYAIFGAGE